MTALGPIPATRYHGRCRACHRVSRPADRVIGLNGWLTRRARRMVCRAGLDRARRWVCTVGLDRPFRQAEGLLQELSGWSVDAETVRRITHEEASAACQGRPEREALPVAFETALGDPELHIDAGKVNTRDGWKDVKVAVFAVRERGDASTSEDIGGRDLPAPSVRSVIAAVEEIGRFEVRCKTEADRLNLTAMKKLSVLGDGAEWIWNAADRQFAGATQVLDVYHAAEHLATAGRAAFGEGPEFQTWFESARQQLLGDGYLGACDALGRPLSDPIASERMAAAAGSELNYFAGHRERMNYAVRLHRGQSIGSGLVEGTIKELVNLRMKRTGARWQAGRVGRFIELLALSKTVEWEEHWISIKA